ncbi:MAG: M28 family peptidase [Erysipelotrichia bacterium]|nr:M28 family peptidase [Erysipelotrichia bacterium]
MKKFNLLILGIVGVVSLIACTPINTDSSISGDDSISDNSDSSSEDPNGPLKNVDDLISRSNAQEHLSYLAGSEIGGRASGSADNLLACQYVADEFQQLGLTPYSEETGYFQPYQQEYTRIFSEYFSFEVTNTAKTATEKYRYAYDFSFFYANFSSFGIVYSPRAFDDQAELVSFSNTSVNYADKIVLVENITLTILGDLYNDGAKGAIVRDGSDPYPTLEYGQGDMFNNSNFLLLYSSGQSYSRLTSNIATGLNKVDASYEIDNASKTVNNVVGFLDVGATSSIIVSAHIDHLGRFDVEDDGYYAGALDNASGIAGMLELARIYSENVDRLLKNVIFIAYNGEEAGLYGSFHYSRNMVGEKADTRASFNLDMIGGGSNDYKLEIIGNYGGLTSSINNKCQEYGIENYIIAENQPNSDHYWLGALRIVSVSFVHFDDRYYHTPNDTEDKINYDIFVNQLAMIASLMLSSYNK